MLLRLPFSKTILVFVKELVRVTAEFLGTPKKSGGGKVGKPRESARRFYQFVTDIFHQGALSKWIYPQTPSYFWEFFLPGTLISHTPQAHLPPHFLSSSNRPCTPLEAHEIYINQK